MAWKFDCEDGCDFGGEFENGGGFDCEGGRWEVISKTKTASTAAVISQAKAAALAGVISAN